MAPPVELVTVAFLAEGRCYTPVAERRAMNYLFRTLRMDLAGDTARLVQAGDRKPADLAVERVPSHQNG